MSIPTRAASLFVGFVLLSPGVASAQAVPGSCQLISGVPITITRPGNYCLTRSASTSAPVAITIDADDVVLDLQGYAIVSTAPNQVNTGVLAESRQDVTVRNGRIRGFYGGVQLRSATIPGRGQNYLVEDLRVEASGVYGLTLDGFNSIVRRCIVTDTGGSSANLIGGTVYGIYLNKGASQVVDTSVIGYYPNPGNGATGYGIFARGGNFVVTGNRVAGGTTGPTVGIQFESTEAGRRDNIVWRVSTPYVGGTDLGNNSSF